MISVFIYKLISLVRYIILLSKLNWEVTVRQRIVTYGRCGVCGQGILRCKCGILIGNM